MNKDRRKRLEDLSEQIDIIKNELEEIRDEEQEARDNLPDNLQESSKAERMDEIIQARNLWNIWNKPVMVFKRQSRVNSCNCKNTICIKENIQPFYI